MRISAHAHVSHICMRRWLRRVLLHSPLVSHCSGCSVTGGGCCALCVTVCPGSNFLARKHSSAKQTLVVRFVRLLETRVRHRCTHMSRAASMPSPPRRAACVCVCVCVRAQPWRLRLRILLMQRRIPDKTSTSTVMDESLRTIESLRKRSAAVSSKFAALLKALHTEQVPTRHAPSLPDAPVSHVGVCVCVRACVCACVCLCVVPVMDWCAAVAHGPDA